MTRDSPTRTSVEDWDRARSSERIAISSKSASVMNTRTWSEDGRGEEETLELAERRRLAGSLAAWLVARVIAGGLKEERRTASEKVKSRVRADMSSLMATIVGGTRSAE